MAETKTHTLFMGVDFSIEQDKQLYRVQDVAGTSFIIRVGDKDVRGPMERGLSKFKIEPKLKLTEVSANVANFKSVRTFTLANDPLVKFQRGLAQAQLQYADAQYSQHLASDILQNVENKPIPSDSSNNAYEAAKAQQIANATADLNTAKAGPGSSFHNDRSAPAETEAFDAMEVTFDLSADRPLNHPYAAIIAQYRAANAQMGQWVYAKALNPIGREAARIHVEQGGFPPGFELQDVQLHLFNQGWEVASSVAPKRVTLTREEAFQYLVVEYIGRHKEATLPAPPLMGKLPSDFPQRLANNEFQSIYYVRVNMEGKMSAVYVDQDCSRKIADPYLESVVKGLRFKPALDQGVPVEELSHLSSTSCRFEPARIYPA